MRNLFLLTALILSTGNAWANIVINGTRIVYPEKNKEVIVQLVNNGDDPSLVQSWIDDGDINSTPETANVPFMLSPPVVKVSGHNGQQLRIKKLSADLPRDRESVFFLNVLDIPPTPENMQNLNTVQLAIKSRIKLFYRPAGIVNSVDKATESLKLYANGKSFTIENKSPLHITLANIEQNKVKLLDDSPMVAPFASTKIASKKVVNKGQAYQVIYIDDLGAYKTITITAE